MEFPFITLDYPDEPYVSIPKEKIPKPKKLKIIKKEKNMNRFEVTSIPLSDYEELTDKVTGEKYHIMCPESDKVCEKMNQLNDRADKIVESFTTEELLKLKWQKDMYERFSKETMRILKKHDVATLQKLDQILFNQVKW